MSQRILFILVSFLLIVTSWKSLHNPRSHGFYRFFAWEAILALFLVQARYWFYRPFAWNQILAWALLLSSLIPLVCGIHSLRTLGRPDRQRADDSSLLAFEKTTTLVTSGIYHYIRHPLYSSLLLLTWGIFFKFPSWTGMLLAIVATLFLLATAKAEERECTQFFGVSYQRYMQATKRFIPYLF